MGECGEEGGEKKKGGGVNMNMYRDVSSCSTYNYGDALYWDARYINEAGFFDWYQRYSALRPFLRRYIPTSSRVLMVGCGNALMSEDMVKDGYEDIMNIDISSIAIDMMRKKYADVPQLKYMQMDVRDMSFFPDESFDSVVDKGRAPCCQYCCDDLSKSLGYLANVSFSSVAKFEQHGCVDYHAGTLDSLMCGTTAPISVSQMLGEVSRLLKPGGIYMLITYGDPTARVPHLNRPGYSWEIILYIIHSNDEEDFLLQPDQGFKGQQFVVLHQNHIWIQFLLLKMVCSLQILFSKIQILTLFMYAKRRMGLSSSIQQPSSDKAPILYEALGSRLRWSSSWLQALKLINFKL